MSDLLKRTSGKERWRRQARRLAAAVILCPLCVAAGPSGDGGDDASFYTAPFGKAPAVPDMTALGRQLFSDPGLSASRRMSCASCHDPRYAYGPPDSAPVRRGGKDLNLPGLRAVPSLRYGQNLPPFSEHRFEGEDGQDLGPSGGRDWDGRAQSAHEQAELPLLSPFEMANADAAALVARVRRAPYAAQFRRTFGEDVLADPALAFKGVLLALEVFQQSPQDFYPYDSKYDAYLRGKASLSPQEQRGLALFNAPDKGNCARCHPAGMSESGFPAFTDFGYAALAVPRNPRIPANRSAAYYDLGLCGPLRKDLADHPEYCGMFRVPTLRNVALRKLYFHNGAFDSLEQVLRFYAQRDTQPQRWYPRRADGSIDAYDDLPPQYRNNVDREPPFGGRPGDQPALSEDEITDIIVFLKTLTDGYRP